MSALLEAVNLTKRYGNVLAVNKVNLTLDPGEVIGLVGPNGAGKTTLIDLITGAQPAEEGHIMLSGKPLSGSMAARARRGLARTFQHPQLALRLSVRQEHRSWTSCAPHGDDPRNAQAILPWADCLDAQERHGCR